MVTCLQDGSVDEEGKNEVEKGDEDNEAEDKLSDIPSSDEAEEDIPNQCLSQFVKVS